MQTRRYLHYTLLLLKHLSKDDNGNFINNLHYTLLLLKHTINVKMGYGKDIFTLHSATIKTFIKGR